MNLTPNRYTWFWTLLVTLAVFSFPATAQKNMNQETNTRFDSYKERFILDLWKLYPVWASSVGFHAFDSVLTVPDEDQREKELAFCKAQEEKLSTFDITQLSDANKTDYYLIDNQLKYTVWGINEQRAWEWDPSSYNIASVFADMLTNEYAPLDERLRNLSKRMDKIPSYYDGAMKNIKNPTIEHTQLAIDQNNGGMSVFTKDLETALQNSGLSSREKQEITRKAKDAASAMDRYVYWLEHLDNKQPRSFRLGRELYEDKFRLDLQSAYTAGQVYQKAIDRKDELHKKMLDLTIKLWPKYFGKEAMPGDKLVAIRKMIDTLSVQHVKPDEFQKAIEKQIPTLVAFIKNKDLLYLDPSKPLVVRKEPDYMAGVAGASISAPGPYDKSGNTYYNVGSLASYSPEEAESFLREYNHYILQILNIHEAIPGHYTQLVYSNQSPSIVKAILGNNAMIEGWAVYTELMMLENGYDGDAATLSREASPEMWLMYYKWNLRSTCNTILDYSVHTRGMDKDAAMDLLVNGAFQQTAEAEGKWRRVTLSQVQLCCYFTGFTEIYDLREELRKTQGASFNLKQFHEKFLSYGSAPVKYIRQMMIK